VMGPLFHHQPRTSPPFRRPCSPIRSSHRHAITRRR
jgi:hypothetical protein